MDKWRKEWMEGYVFCTWMMRVIVFLGLAYVCFADGEWNYNFSGPIGPDHWANRYPACNGSSQSPINIVTSSVMYDSSLGKLQFNNFDRIPSGAKIMVRNNGHAFQVNFMTPNLFYVHGGGLGANFTTAQFHMHLGEDDTRGAEHLIDGQRNAACIHIVNYNTKYPDISTAANKSDGLAVIGVILEVGAENAGLAKVLKYVENVTKVGNVSDLAQEFSLGSLLPSNTDFFRYKGSLTTPPCYESVTWTVMKTKTTISHDQLMKLRSIMEKDGVHKITDNYRHILQPLNGRTVKSNFMGPTTASTTTANPNSAELLLASIMTFFMAILPFILW
ncbi:carbonic anhydrase isoform X2 [Nematostella vectensis]|uniref:carbonic anhydrase isoform X2 n=1 Tax=Nematostella vectensis TaxID=45351 RepID=UPI00138FF02F|nr:carbonic anhydrase isoform X2 [Nematostella vectensis]